MTSVAFQRWVLYCVYDKLSAEFVWAAVCRMLTALLCQDSDPNRCPLLNRSRYPR